MAALALIAPVSTLGSRAHRASRLNTRRRLTVAAPRRPVPAKAFAGAAEAIAQIAAEAAPGSVDAPVWAIVVG